MSASTTMSDRERLIALLRELWQAGEHPDDLFDYCIRRPQCIRSRWIAAAVLLVALCPGAVGWWRVEQLRQDSAFREYTALQGQVKDLPVGLAMQDLAQAKPAPATTPEALAAKPPAIAATSLATRTNSIGMELIRVPAGKYQRGARDGETLAEDDEKPRHWVQISNPFDAGRYPVTQGQYTKVMGHNPSWFSSTGGGSDHVHEMDTTAFPVEYVSFFDTLEFCNKLSALEKLKPYYELTNVQRDGQTITSATVKILGGNGYRLLTEAEWEYIARAGTDTAFPWGDSLSSTQANFDGNYPYGGTAEGPYLERTTKVGSYQPNAWGFYGTVGNVWEWVWDVYNANEYQQFANKTAIDPMGPNTGESQVLRGGCWYVHGQGCGVANRLGYGPEYRDYDYGFRVAQGQSSE